MARRGYKHHDSRVLSSESAIFQMRKFNNLTTQRCLDCNRLFILAAIRDHVPFLHLYPGVHGHVCRVPHVLLPFEGFLPLLAVVRPLWNLVQSLGHLHYWDLLRVLVSTRKLLSC